MSISGWLPENDRSPATNPAGSQRPFRFSTRLAAHPAWSVAHGSSRLTGGRKWSRSGTSCPPAPVPPPLAVPLRPIAAARLTSLRRLRHRHRVVVVGLQRLVGVLAPRGQRRLRRVRGDQAVAAVADQVGP